MCRASGAIDLPKAACANNDRRPGNPGGHALRAYRVMTSEPISVYRRLVRPLVFEPSGGLSARSVWATSAVIVAGLAYYHWFYEGWRETIIFAGAVTTALVALLTFFSRRILFSLAVIAALTAIIVIASDVKRHFIEMVLHAYDVVFYMTSFATLQFLWVDHRVPLIALAAALISTAVLGWTLYRIDTSRVPRAVSAVVLIFATATAAWASYAKGERRNTLFYWDHLYLSSFYASWSETLETLWKGQLLDARAHQNKPLFKMAQMCDLKSRPPHIILIHQESVVPPELFPKLRYDTSLDPFFRSFDGELHKLRVETYGGASWLTEFSVLAGLSTYSFGGMRTFVQSLMQGKVHDTLPQVLKRCGYRNSVFYPVPKDFVSNGSFYASAGMPEIFDYKAQGATRFNERDSFYYGNALKYFTRHISMSSAPTFTFIITSATHLPYTNTYEPTANVVGGGPGTDPEMSEYLRRLAMAKMDYQDFKAALDAQFPNERFLIVAYGDHQPVATRTLLGFDKSLDAEDVKMSPDSPGFLTYYSVDGIHYTPSPLPEVDALDVPYLGTVLLQAARIPLPGDYTERQRLLAVCGGRYFTCGKQRQILGFHRRLIDSGLIDAR
jgi:phosphoglycerol transferase MdoB-like AlkP superfamily enzyme